MSASKPCLYLCLLLVACVSCHELPRRQELSRASAGRLLDVSALRAVAEPMPDWESLFRPGNSDWQGGDGCYSVPLGRHKTLWLFGDTWIQPGGKPRGKGGDIINNSAAIQEWNAVGGEPPRFFWGRSALGKPEALFLPEKQPGFLWPLSGVRVGGQVFVFAAQVVPDKKTWIALPRTLLCRVTNPRARPEDWRIEKKEIPFFRKSDHGYTLFCSSAFVRERNVYIFGFTEDWRQGGKGRSAVLARCSLGAFLREDFAGWRFRTKDGWSPRMEEAVTLFNGVATEFSVSRLPSLDAYVAVYSSQDSPGEIVGRFSRSPEGPWSPPLVLYRCHDDRWNKRYSYYAAKAHPELATADNELIITYATNSDDLEDLARDSRLYFPRFVRVKIERVAPEGGRRPVDSSGRSR